MEKIVQLVEGEIVNIIDGSGDLGYKRAHSLNGIKTISQGDIDDVLLEASTLVRAREPILIHESFDDVPQRFVNCLQSNSYVRPHMHVVPNQWELMSWISGEITALIFDDKGTIIRKISMNEHGVKLIEIPPFCYHSFVAVGQGVYLEVRNCRYQPSVDRLYSAWSPPEESELAGAYQKRLSIANVGEMVIM